MRRIFLLATMGLLAACSSTRHQGFFYPKFENTSATVTPQSVPTIAEAPAQNLTASISKEPVTAIENVPTATQIETVRRTYLQLNKEERKEIRKLIKAEIKNYTKDQKAKLSPDRTAANMDNDLKLGAIFGAVGIVALIIGGDVFWIIGGIALIIGVIFFVKWLVRQ